MIVAALLRRKFRGDCGGPVERDAALDGYKYQRNRNLPKGIGDKSPQTYAKKTPGLMAGIGTLRLDSFWPLFSGLATVRFELAELT